MKPQVLFFIAGLTCSAFAADCINSYDKSGCNKVTYDVGSGMSVSQYSVIYDKDQDGVADSLDKCPDTRSKAVVDREGCEIKAQAIIPKAVKSVDAAPVVITQAPAVEDATEAKVVQVALVTLKVNFDTSKFDIKEQYFDEIGKMAEFLIANPSYYAKVVGHTDSTGDKNKNTKLSFDRANAVKNMLITLGVEASHMSADGKGPNEPIATNFTKEGRALNRRIEVDITKKGE